MTIDGRYAIASHHPFQRSVVISEVISQPQQESRSCQKSCRHTGDDGRIEDLGVGLTNDVEDVSTGISLHRFGGGANDVRQAVKPDAERVGLCVTDAGAREKEFQ